MPEISLMDAATAKKRFNQQKSSARERGIEWRLTFAQWVEWWGDDLDRRGRGVDQLCMQRFGDMGSYALDNIRKGSPRENAKTRGATCRRVLISPFRYKTIVGDVPVKIPYLGIA